MPRSQAASNRRHYESVRSAAHRLALSPTALRARLRRGQRWIDGRLEADIGNGIVGHKFGRTWRIVIEPLGSDR